MSDFDIQQDGDAIILVGHLTDSTNLEPFIEKLSTAQKVTFSKLYSVTWFGLQNLFHKMSEVSRDEVQIHDVPAGVYRLALMFPVLGTKIKPITFQVETSHPGTAPEVLFLSMDELVQLGKQQGAFVSLPSGPRVRGALFHLCRPFFLDHRQPSLRSDSASLAEYESDCLFWYNYFCFSRFIMEFNAIAQRGTMLLVEESLQQILIRLLNAQQAYNVIHPEQKENRGRALMALLPFVQETSQKTFVRFSDKAAEIAAIIARMEEILLAREFALGEFLSCLDQYLDSILRAKDIMDDLDRIGFEIGEKVFSFGECNQCFETLARTPPESVTDKLIASIRRKMKMATVENPGWEETAAEIKNEHHRLLADLNRCIIAMQGFDVVRQVVEHRVAEAVILQQSLDGLKKDLHTSATVGASILNAAFQKLVTEQEKHSFQFFFPENDNQLREKLQPGAVTFFF